MPSALETEIARFRAEIAQLDAGAARQIVTAYTGVWQGIEQDAKKLTLRIQSAQESGTEVNPHWLAQDERYRTLRAQVEAEISRFAGAAGEMTTAAQKQAVSTALRNTSRLAQVSAGPAPSGIAVPWHRLPADSMFDLVGVLGNGAPLSNLLGTMPAQAGSALEKSLVEGLALGKNPVQMVAGIKQELGGSAVQALRIQRTETMRALRAASSREYGRNKDVLEGWIWSCAPSDKTCAMCYAMDGTKHDAGETMDTHPSCRCSQIPRTKSWADLGFDIPDRRPSLDGPGEKFGRLNEDGKRTVLGPAKLQALQDGKIRLPDLVQETHSPIWGPGRREASLAEALGGRGGAPAVRFPQYGRLLPRFPWLSDL